MRPKRTRGTRKSYVEQYVGLDHDDEPFSVADISEDDADFDAKAAEEQQNQDENDRDENVDHDAAASSDEGPLQDGTAPGNSAVASADVRPKRHRNAGAGMTQSRKSFHDIPHYPLETRIVTRVYAGPLRRYARYSALRDSMYGPEYQRIKIIWDLEKRWQDFSVLPPRYPQSHPQGVVPSPWVPLTFERDQQRRALLWYDDYHANSSETQRTRVISAKHGESLVQQAGGDIVTLSGPVQGQKQYQLSPATGIPIAESGIPLHDAESKHEKAAAGWILDAGGIPLALAWAPSTQRHAQLLAIATIPFSDQDLPKQEPRQGHQGETEKPDTSAGSIQFWQFEAAIDSQGLASPSKQPPIQLLVRCFDWGRPKRLEWCPVPLASSGIYGLLAVLCGDGQVRVIDVQKVVGPEEVPIYEWMESPVATLGITSDYGVEATCLAWINVNRIALGHSDGSVTLWSVFPRRLLQRLGVHTTYIIDMCSAYPSNPYLVATIPVGGCATLTDLSQPSSEFTYFPVPAISFQPNMVCWNEPMQGFLGLYPSSTPNTTVAFLHHRYFSQARSICTGPNAVTCVSAGATHPFLLMGCADGSVYCCNALQKLFKQKGEPLRKIKVLEHEFRPLVGLNSPPRPGSRPLRGASRILQGFLPELNDDPRTEKRKELDRKKRLATKNKTSAKKKGGRKGAGGGDDGDKDNLAELDDKLASRVISHEPLTRVTNITWNPNPMFSCWAACAMGSGLVRVMDLGVQ